MKLNWKVLAISITTYLIFFYPVLSNEMVLYSGKDAGTLHYPAKFYLEEKLKSETFPFWTERVFSGFPIYLDLEKGYLDPVNIGLVYAFGPFLSYKIQHFVTYLIGSYGLYLLLKRHKHTELGYALGNLVYFFSFFMLYHQQHFNMINAFYLLPLILYLTHNFFTDKKISAASWVAVLLAYVFYMGSFQPLAMIGIVEILYVFFMFKNTKRKYEGVIFWLVQGFLFFILIFPVLKSVYNLHLSSNREYGADLFTQGSYSPLMLVNALVPFLYGRGEDYKGVIIHRDYLMHETYIYVGIVAFLVGVFGYLNLKEVNEKRFLNWLFCLFVILSVLKFIPILDTYGLFPFSLFRYWIRSALFLVFGMTFLVSYFFSTTEFITKPSARQWFALFSPVLFLGIIEAITFRNERSLAMLKLFFRSDYRIDPSIYVWVVIGLLSVLCILLIKKHKVFYKFLIVLLVFDIIFFGKLVLQNAFVSPADIFERIDTSQIKNIRTFDSTNKINGNNALFYDTWGLLGYSIFAPKQMDLYLRSLGFQSIKTQGGLSDTHIQSDYFKQELQKLGVQKMITYTGTSDLNIPTFPLKDASFEIFKITSLENVHTIYLKNNEPETVRTYIRYDPSWYAFIDGVRYDVKNENGYLSFDIPPQTDYVVLKYVPLTFYKNVLYSLGALIPFVSFTKLANKKLKAST